MMGSTPAQAQLLRFLRTYSAEHGGVMPTTDEMRGAVGLRSKSGVARLLDGLQGRGLIRRMPNRARGIEIVDGDEMDDATERELDAYCAATGHRRRAVIATALAAHFRANPPPRRTT